VMAVHKDVINSPVWFLFFALVSVGLLLLGGWLTYLGLDEWYYQLDFPPFQPPPWLFTPVWVVVLTCLAPATWLVARKVEVQGPLVMAALMLYGAQVVLNGGWSLLFFTMQRPDIALWELYILDGVVLSMAYTYGRVSRTAALLLIPYLVWLALSTAINLWIVQHNTFALTPG
jgi:benzodiazapine receptor